MISAKPLGRPKKYHSEIELREARRVYHESWRAENRDHRAASLREWRRANKESVKASQQKWRAKNPDYNRDWALRKTYGISLQEKKAMLLSQGSMCAICKSEKPRGKDWNLDHCHTTGRIRGILCTPCNLLLGKVKDSVELLQSAIEYLSDGRKS